MECVRGWDMGEGNEMKQFGNSALENTVQILGKIFSVLWNVGHQGDLPKFTVQCQAGLFESRELNFQPEQGCTN
jgi:hypothetical protein